MSVHQTTGVTIITTSWKQQQQLNATYQELLHNS